MFLYFLTIPSLIKYTLLVFLLHKLFQYSLYVLFGLKFSYINPFTLSIYKLQYVNDLNDEKDSVFISIDKIRLKFSLFQSNTKSYVGVTISNVEVDIRKIDFFATKDETKNEQPTPESAEKPSLKAISKSNDHFDPSLPVSIFPSGHKLRRLTNFLINSLPHLSFEILNIKLLATSQLNIVFDTIVGTTDISINNKSSLLKTTGNNIIHNWLTSLKIVNCHLLSQTSNEIYSKFFNQAEFSINFKIDLNDGIISDVEPILSLSHIDISILYILKLIKAFNSSFKIGGDSRSGTDEYNSNEQLESLKMRKYKLYLYSFVYRLLKKTIISVQSLMLSEIPLTTISKLNNFLDCQNEESIENIVFLSLNIGSLTTNVGPINSNQVGYSLKFVTDSYPLQWLIMFGNIKMSLDYSKLSGYRGNCKKFDVIFIPNILYSMESTMMINLLRVVFNRSIQEHFVQKQTVTFIQLTLSRPSIDISTEQLLLLLKVIGEIQMDLSIHKNDDEHIDYSVNEPDSANTITQINQLYRKTFLSTLPKFQIKLLIEEPLLIIKSENELIPEKEIHMLILKPTLIGLQFDALTVDSFMNLDSRIDVPEFPLIYQRNNSNSSSSTIVLVKDISLKTSFQIFDLNDVKISFNIHSLLIDLTNLQALNGLSIIINSVHENYLKYDLSSFQKSRQDEDNSEGKYKSWFNDLPPWFFKLYLSLNSIKIKLGAKSIFMPMDDLVDEYNHQMDAESRHHMDNKNLLTSSNIILRIGKMDFSLRNKTKDLSFIDSGSSSKSSYIKSPENYYWFVANSFRDISIQSIIHQNDMKKTILHVSNIRLNLFCKKSGIFELSNIFDSILIDHDVSSHFVLFSAINLLGSIFRYHSSVLSGKDDEKNLEHQSASDRKDNSSESDTSVKRMSNEQPSLLKILNLKWFVKEFQVIFEMPQNSTIRLDLLDLKGYKNQKLVILENKLLRVSVLKFMNDSVFNRLFIIDDIKMIYQLINLKLKIINNSVRISIPSNFVVHSLFDSIILTVKSTKKFISTIRDGLFIGADKISPAGVILLPNMKLKSNTVSFILDDDPFESELNMIFQLGLVEQKARIKKLDYYENFTNNLLEKFDKEYNDSSKLTELKLHLKHLKESNIARLEIKDNDIKSIVDTLANDLHKLRFNNSKSWIKLVEEFKLKKDKIIEMNMDFLSGNTLNLNNLKTKLNENIIDFNNNPPLMSVLLDDVVINLNPNSFKDFEPREYLHKVGKGIPYDTKWDKIVPLKFKLVSSEFRVHLRDFPLPFVYVPNSKHGQRWSDSFVMDALLVLAEPMPVSDKEYWYENIRMLKSVEADDTLYSWNSPKTICSIKAYYNIDFYMNSDNSTMVTWSTGYQSVLRHLDLIFETFSKETKDPSPKLGVWDKLRNIMHGFFHVKWTHKDSEVRINILNSFDPYKIFTKNAGFTCVFKEDVEWLINDPDRELERDYFIFRSKRILFGIPNFLAEPLPAWCSRRLMYMKPNSEDDSNMINSMYGYYLNNELYFQSGDQIESLVLKTLNYRFKTLNICLDGDLELKLSMRFERELDDGSITTDSKAHYENVLTSPKFVDDENFDSYKGFRSKFIHMGFNLNAKNSKHNTLRLSPRSFFQFFRWFKRFGDDPSLPIRNGKLWESKDKSVKLGDYLMTFKFKFDVEPLYIFHGYRVDLTKVDNQKAIGLKAKIASFKCDLHERKEKKVKQVQFLNTSHKVLKMEFYIGKVELNDIDLRVVGLKFREASNLHVPKHRFQIFDNDKSWIDILDFEEVDLPSLKTCDIDGQIFPLLHSSHFCYWMNTSVEKSRFGNEDSHECLIDKNDFPDVKYNHVFDVNELKMKWNSSVGNILFEYIIQLQFRTSYLSSLSFNSRRAIDKMLEESFKTDQLGSSRFSHLDSDSDSEDENKLKFSQINDDDEFHEIMRKVQAFYKQVVPVDDMLIRFSDVQVQLMIEPDDEDMILFRTKHNEIEIVSIMDKDWFKYVKSAHISKRFGTIFQDADLIILSKKEYLSLNIENSNYGTTSVWPAFLSGSEPSSFIESKTLLSDVLIYFVFEKTSDSYALGKRRNRMFLNVPSLQTKIDSNSYLVSFKLLSELFKFASPYQKEFIELTKSLSLTAEDEDKRGMLKALENTCYHLVELTSIQQTLAPMKYISDTAAKLEIIVRERITRCFSNGLLLSKVLFLTLNRVSEQDDDDCYIEFNISAREIKVDLVENDHAFLHFSMKDGLFQRYEMINESTINEVSIGEIKILNNDYDILFPELLSSFQGTPCQNIKKPEYDEMLRVKWELSQTIGGVHNIKDFKISCHPMNISMEDKTGYKLMHFLFPDEIKQKLNDEDEEEEAEKAFLEEFTEDETDNDYYETDELDNETSTASSKKSHIENETTQIANDAKDKFSSIVPDILINKFDNASKSSKTSFDSSRERSDERIIDILHSEDDNESIRSYVRSLISNKSDDIIPIQSNTNSVFSRPKSLVSSNYSKTLSKQIIEGKKINTGSRIDKLMGLNAEGMAQNTNEKHASTNKESRDHDEDNEDILMMTKRAKEYFTIKHFEFSDIVLSITLFGRNTLRLVNVNDLVLIVPKFEVRNVIWTSVDMINAVKKHVIKTLLKQTGKLLKNKLFVYKKKKRFNKKTKSMVSSKA